MNSIVLMALGLVQLATKLIPIIEDAFRRGEIPAEKQAEVKKSIDDLRTALANSTAFTGPEWEVKP